MASTIESDVGHIWCLAFNLPATNESPFNFTRYNGLMYFYD
ncbi:hypothetical protein Meth11DRAFT_0868 [Methylophilaceae bacterium 11]|nr:hypothetical protein Meth11DRAFT_0868 [Methylophilaceae bacterium 11]